MSNEAEIFTSASNQEEIDQNKIDAGDQDDLNGKEKSNKNDNQSVIENPDSYLNRNEYTSEKYKLEIKNLPKNFGFAVNNAFKSDSSFSVIQ